MSDNHFGGNIQPGLDLEEHQGDKNAKRVYVVEPIAIAGDIEIGAVEIKNSTDDTRATVGANGLHVDVQTSVLPTGAATSAKQDTLLTELQLKADLTETQPVSVATIPSHAVTNAGTFAVQVTSAPTTAVTGTFYQATQPVSIATMPSTPVTGTFYQATQPVSGTVTANLSATDNTVLDNIDTAVTSKYITGIGHGVKTVTTAGTDVVLATSTPCKKVDIQAQTDNTGLIAVGGSGVDATVATGTGILLNAGDVFSLEIDNLADIYIDSTVNTDGVRFTYFT